MSGPTALQIVLRRRVRRSLEALSRSSRAPHARVRRARFAARPQIAALNDDMRVGRPSTVPMLARLELVKLACSRPADCKAPFPNDDVVPQTRFRRVGVHKWEIEMPLMGGGWNRTSLRGQLAESVELVVTQFPWMLAPRR